MKYYVNDSYTLCDRCRWNSDELFNSDITGYLCKPYGRELSCDRFEYITGSQREAINVARDPMKYMSKPIRKWWEHA